MFVDGQDFEYGEAGHLHCSWSWGDDFKYSIDRARLEDSSNHWLLCFCWHQGHVEVLQFDAKGWSACAHVLSCIAAWKGVHGIFQGSWGGGDWSVSFSFWSRRNYGYAGLKVESNPLPNTWTGGTYNPPPASCTSQYTNFAEETILLWHMRLVGRSFWFNWAFRTREKYPLCFHGDNLEDLYQTGFSRWEGCS